ncbi:hypothetical protein F383_26274 [Gossypium arboreum]|uniref:Uncharacterized protein n=1 Tax=Gossypium arboreum TaxID=29729 RepID=A0A0B0MQX0_GOSAR|nr:hypothetical protein F383_26274 [Gossypium arboreum]
MILTCTYSGLFIVTTNISILCSKKLDIIEFKICVIFAFLL